MSETVTAVRAEKATRKGRQTDEAFREAARVVFARDGYLNAKISEIAAEAGPLLEPGGDGLRHGGGNTQVVHGDEDGGNAIVDGQRLCPDPLRYTFRFRPPKAEAAEPLAEWEQELLASATATAAPAEQAAAVATESTPTEG